MPTSRLARGGLAALAIFLLALWPRMSLPERVVTADEDTWLGLTGNFAEALAEGRPERTYQVGHPGVTALWSSLLGLGFEGARRYEGLVVYDDRVLSRRSATRQAAFLQDLNAARRGHAVVNAALVAGLALLAARVLTWPIGLLAGALNALDPFLVAHAQVIRMDSLQAGFVAVALLALLARWLRDGGRAYVVLAGFAVGLALLSKTSSALFLPVAGALAVWTLGRRLVTRAATAGAILRAVGDVGLLALISLLVCLLGFPALWAAPVESLTRIVDYTIWNGGSPPAAGNYFIGTPALDPGPLFYPVAFVFRATPLALLGLAALVVLSGRLRSCELSVPLWIIVTTAVFSVALAAAPKKADRYLLPIWPLVVLLGAVGLNAVVESFGQRRRILGGAIALAAAAQLIWLPPLAPYALAYFNPLLGGAAGASRALPVGWGEGLEHAADYLNALPGADQIAAATLYVDALRPNFHGRSLPLTRYAEADYLLDYINMDQRDLYPPELESHIAAIEATSTVEIGGVRYVDIYRLRRPEFGGELRFDGYQLDSQIGERDERLTVWVRWTPLSEQSLGWRPRVELLDGSGTARASADASSTAAPPGQPRSADVRIRLPDVRMTLVLALSVRDAYGQPIAASSLPPWAKLEQDRVVLPSITLRVR